MNTTEFSNCRVVINEKGILTATLDLNKDVGLSSTGKSINVGTSQGNKKLVHNDKIFNFGLNCYLKNEKYVQTEEDKARLKKIYGK